MKQDEVTAAVRKLRLGLEDTQQAFATRLGMAISTVVRYEHNRPPSGRALAKLEQVAQELGFEEYADVFRTALGKELGKLPVAILKSLDCKTDEERELVEAMLGLVRLAPDSKEAGSLKKLLAPQVKEIRELRDARKAYDESLEAIVRLLKAGRTVPDIRKSFRAEHIADALFRCSYPALINEKTGEVVALLLAEHHSIDDIAEEWFNSDKDDVVGVAMELGLYQAVSEHESFEDKDE